VVRRDVPTRQQHQAWGGHSLRNRQNRSWISPFASQCEDSLLQSTQYQSTIDFILIPCPLSRRHNHGYSHEDRG
jgi:hypothetical protein